MRTAAAEVCIKLKARVHDLRNRLGLLDVTPSKTEKRVHVYGIVSRETRDSTNINFTIARRRGAIVDLHVDTVHVYMYSICACEIADFAPKNSSDLHLSRGPPRRRTGVLEPPQPPPPGYAPEGHLTAGIMVVALLLSAVGWDLL